MKNKNMKKILVSALVLAILVAVFYFSAKAITSITGKTVVNDEEKIASFAKCLSDKGVSLYVRNGCRYCADQKAMFSKEALSLLNITECLENPTICSDEGIEHVPAWKINGQLTYGFQSFEKLSELSGCKLN